MSKYAEYKFYKQLVAFHEGDPLAVAEDLARIKGYVAKERADDFDDYVEADDDLSCLFFWRNTTEGAVYWKARSVAL